jgi:hypothetical protein
MRARRILILGLALAVRLALFPFADNKQGDAPMRALIAERLNSDAGAAGDPRTYCQFGPLHLTLMRPFLALADSAPWSSRVLSLLAGLLTFFPFLRLAHRLVGSPGADLAGFALALSPLHVQLSITAASEALFLLLVVLAIDRLLVAMDGNRARTFAGAGIWASLAAVTRYDAWLLWPAVALAAWLLATPASRAAQARGLAIFLAVTAVLPLGWLAWSAAVAGDPFFFAHYISNDHALLGAAASAAYGDAVARARQLGIWTLSFAAVMTPPLLFGAGAALRRFRALDSGARLIAVAALVPPLVYLVHGLATLRFEPLARFALVPGVLLLPLAARELAARWNPGRVRAWIAAGAVAGSAVVLAAAWLGRDRVWQGAESLAPLTRLPAEDRQLAGYLRAHRRADESIMIDVRQYDDIALTHASGTPARLSVTLSLTRRPEASVARTLAVTGARWLAVRDDSWAFQLAGDWPPTTLRFGRWRLLHIDGAAPGSG